MRQLYEYELPILEACKCVNIELTEQMLQQFEDYYKTLVEWNEKMNLTAITEKKEVYLKHFADSIYGVKFINQGATVCDIGTGAGFPAVVLKIVRPDLKVTLVDALDKRVKFLSNLVSILHLTNIEALHFRAEDKTFKQSYLNNFDIVTARAVAKMVTLSEYCLPFVKVGGVFLAYKSDKIEDELQESKRAISTLGGEVTSVDFYNLDSEITRLLVVTTKVTKTLDIYPRDKNKPKLSPIL